MLFRSLSDLTTGKVFADYDTVQAGKHYNSEIRVFGSEGLHAYYLGVAQENCNVYSGIGCGAVSEIFNVFGNTFTPGAWRVKELLLIAPVDGSTRTVHEARVTDGVRTKVVRLHLYVK